MIVRRTTDTGQPDYQQGGYPTSRNLPLIASQFEHAGQQYELIACWDDDGRRQMWIERFDPRREYWNRMPVPDYCTMALGFWCDRLGLPADI